MKDFLKKMKTRAKLFGIYLPIFIVLIIAAVTLRTVALFLNFSPDTSYFSGKGLITAADITVITGALFLFTYVFYRDGKMKLIPSFTTPATYVPVGILSVASLFIIEHLIRVGKDVKEYIDYLKAINTPSATAKLSSQNILFILLVAAIIFAALSIAHFVLTAIDERQSSTKRASFGICTVVFLAVYSAYLYFDTTLPLNAPNKILDQMAYLFSSLFFLYETRLSLGREKWRSYIAFGFIASLITAYSSIPSALYYFATDRLTSNSVYEIALTLALFIFITARLFLTGELIEDKPSHTVENLIKFADARTAEIIPAENAEEKEESKNAEDNGADYSEKEGAQITFDYFDENGDVAPILHLSDSKNENEEKSDV